MSRTLVRRYVPDLAALLRCCELNYVRLHQLLRRTSQHSPQPLRLQLQQQTTLPLQPLKQSLQLPVIRRKAVNDS